LQWERGRETKAEGQAVTMQWNLNAKTQRFKGARSGGGIDWLIRASLFRAPKWPDRILFASSRLCAFLFAKALAAADALKSSCLIA
jgi:hypothetical protein